METNSDELNTKIKGLSNNPILSFVLDIRSFEDGIKRGIYSDAKGNAYLIINGTLYSSYNVYIDRRCITKSGCILSFDGLMKQYTDDQIQIRYDVKERIIPARKVLIKEKEMQDLKEDA